MVKSRLAYLFLILSFVVAAHGSGRAIGPPTEQDQAPVPAAKVENDQVDFVLGKDLVASYHKGASVAKPYFWPVLGPHGEKLTRAWPMEKPVPAGSIDHPHQKSVWFCHGDVIPEGLSLKQHVKGVDGVDFWSEAKGHGRIVCKAVNGQQSAKNYGRVKTSNDWVSADEDKILEEYRTITLYGLGDARLFVFDIDLHASVVPITFGDTKEGSFGVRVNDLIREKGGKGKIENSTGNTGERACWGQRAAWCDYSGPLEGRIAGVALFDDPANRYPACWHVRDYGLMAANPFGRTKSKFPAMKGNTELVKLAKGEHLKLRYGLLLHSGDAREGKVNDIFQTFVKLGKEEKD
jgi:hypothetical protein